MKRPFVQADFYTPLKANNGIAKIQQIWDCMWALCHILALGGQVWGGKKTRNIYVYIYTSWSGLIKLNVTLQYQFSHSSTKINLLCLVKLCCTIYYPKAFACVIPTSLSDCGCTIHTVKRKRSMSLHMTVHLKHMYVVLWIKMYDTDHDVCVMTCTCMHACIFVCIYVWMDGWMDQCT